MGALILSMLLAQPLTLEKLPAAGATAWFSKSRLEASPAKNQYIVVNEPVTILLAEGSGTAEAVVSGLQRILEPKTPRPTTRGWEALLWNYVHAGPTSEPKVRPRSVTIDGRTVAGAEFTVGAQGRPLYSGLLLTQLLPGARVRVVLGIREGDAKGWLGEVGPPAAFLLTEGAAWFSPAPIFFGQPFKVPTGCSVEPTAAGSKRITIGCDSKATLTWAPIPKEPDLAEYRRTLEQGARDSPCELSFKQPACTVAGLAAECLLAECKPAVQASSLTAKLKFEDRHYLVICANAPRGWREEPLCNGLFQPAK